MHASLHCSISVRGDSVLNIGTILKKKRVETKALLTLGETLTINASMPASAFGAINVGDYRLD